MGTKKSCKIFLLPKTMCVKTIERHPNQNEYARQISLLNRAKLKDVYSGSLTDNVHLGFSKGLFNTTVTVLASKMDLPSKDEANLMKQLADALRIIEELCVQYRKSHMASLIFNNIKNLTKYGLTPLQFVSLIRNSLNPSMITPQTPSWDEIEVSMKNCSFCKRNPATCRTHKRYNKTYVFLHRNYAKSYRGRGYFNNNYNNNYPRNNRPSQ